MKPSIIDCDIHHSTPIDEVKQYLPRFYREMVEVWGPRYIHSLYLNGTKDGKITDETAPGNDASSDKIVEYYIKNLFEPFNLEYGILTGMDYSAQASPDIDFASAICTAYNDYTVEQWMGKDRRLKGSIMIPKQDPELSVKEINRLGSHPDLVQVIVSSGAEKPYGHRFYHPIYKACVEHNLPFTIHVTTEGAGINVPPSGAGYVSYYAEYRALRPQVMAAHLASFIYEGVFEKFPNLKVVLQEAGVFWIVPLLWRLDQDWKGLRHQTPWVKKPPSEYFRSNVRVTTQPLEPTPDRDMFQRMMKEAYAEECLLFCSDFPHWDIDSPRMAFPKMEDSLWEKVFYQNAADLYGLPARGAHKGGVIQ